jgi:hypothetical protein
MPLPKFSYQLPLELDGPEVEVPSLRGVINIDERKLRKQMARNGLDSIRKLLAFAPFV